MDGELEVAKVSVGPVADNCMAKVLETLPAVAVRVTTCAVATDDTVAVNPALVAFVGTVTVAGTVTAAPLLDRLTLKPPLGAAALSVTMQASVPEPIMDALLHERALTATSDVAVVPVPLRPITSVPVAEELLVMVNCPEAVPAAVGLN